MFMIRIIVIIRKNEKIIHNEINYIKKLLENNNFFIKFYNPFGLYYFHSKNSDSKTNQHKTRIAVLILSKTYTCNKAIASQFFD